MSESLVDVPCEEEERPCGKEEERKEAINCV